jgi:predicted lipoprotein with Yx(FWY)xxD motif
MSKYASPGRPWPGSGLQGRRWCGGGRAGGGGLRLVGEPLGGGQPCQVADAGNVELDADGQPVHVDGGRDASGSRLVAASGAGFALATLGGYLLSVWAGLFGFKEIRTTAGIVAGVVEVAAFATLAAFAATPATRRQPTGQATAPSSRLLARLQAGIPGVGWAVGGISLAALVVLGISVEQAGGPAPTPASASGTLKTATIGGVTVLTNAQGFTLYWFAPDTPTRSACYGTCAGYWPPVIETPSAGPGKPGTLATIQRSDGTTQATYNGHPLYTYVGDTAPGQAFGNNLNLNGGLWHEVTVPG